MKLYNAILIFDTYVPAESPEAAHAALLAAVRNGDIKPTEHTTREARNEREVRPSQRDEKPVVADDVSDKDFEKLKGKTIIEIYRMLYTK